MNPNLAHLCRPGIRPKTPGPDVVRLSELYCICICGSFNEPHVQSISRWADFHEDHINVGSGSHVRSIFLNRVAKRDQGRMVICHYNLNLPQVPSRMTETRIQSSFGVPCFILHELITWNGFAGSRHTTGCFPEGNVPRLEADGRIDIYASKQSWFLLHHRVEVQISYSSVP